MREGQSKKALVSHLGLLYSSTMQHAAREATTELGSTGRYPKRYTASTYDMLPLWRATIVPARITMGGLTPFWRGPTNLDLTFLFWAAAE
ncbi:hypothetical protein N7468_003441 [Penicillium chermesinum]|uniref:Uncharacterized protein n=1 Tax=Penicillium chermesinum TaxID=63820 RepID=A0A9W9TRT5_9EURO|nr:uncharacterized protein N7468_003441 [Penicillium chermesinum]KAJ5238822.1 hypothetical protein N7468_003441 [Penicillium chermesinum]